jgi:hypothetical protein
LYDIAADANGINATYSKWEIQYTLAASGAHMELASGYIYMPIYAGLNPTSVTVNNVVAAVTTDTTGLKTGLTGYYVTFPDLVGGSTSTITIHLTETAAMTNGNYVITMYDDAACNNALLRWWDSGAGTPTTLPVEGGP